MVRVQWDNKVIGLFVKASLINACAQVYDALDHNLRNTRVVNVLMDELPKSRRINDALTRQCGKAWDLLNERMSLGGDVKMASCNALLRELGKECDFVKMNLLMEEMKEREFHQMLAFEKTNDGDFRIETDVVLYNTLIDGLCKVGRREEGLKLMESKCKPNTITYNCLIDGFSKVVRSREGKSYLS
ncbi:pentatricopeptide repeat-containing protein At5g28460-like [Olea europaea var. sylvestris]|uniref:pentatricopeptide repeat-containing protein At5g28460-like n=1 Tax=Olea europaea var. sylvestris TaxID=158386 RepID=UPI000C1D75AB|nr:pentatricopeptide repeat-containing protein At5g28460-like [Olea europaea var. sylvestris]